MFKKYIVLPILCLSMFVVSSCGKFDENMPVENTKEYVAVITKSVTSDFWKSTAAGAKAAGTEYNLDVSFQGPENEEDYETQNEMVYQAIEDGASVIVFSAVDYNANAQAIEDAIDQGVKVIIIDSDVNSDKVSCHISTDNYKAGRMVGQALLVGNEEPLKVGIVNFDENSENGQKREHGFRDYIADSKEVEIVASINVNSTTEDAKEGTIDMLKEHPEINAIVTFNEWTSLGVGEAVKEKDLSEKTKVVAFDSNILSVEMLEIGVVDALIVQNPYAMGYLGVEYAARIINGENVNGTVVDTITTMITRENMFNPENQKVLFSFD